MKEEEAKTKWCPQVRQTQDSEPAANRWVRYEQSNLCNCIASDCMCWKWDISPQSADDINRRGNASATADGHCGLTK